MEYKKIKVVTEKYVIDSFYFMTNLENELNDSEYLLNIEGIEGDYSL